MRSINKNIAIILVSRYIVVSSVLPSTNIFSALEVLHIMRYIKLQFTYLLTLWSKNKYPFVISISLTTVTEMYRKFGYTVSPANTVCVTALSCKTWPQRYSSSLSQESCSFQFGNIFIKLHNFSITIPIHYLFISNA